jgi:hypothetical protein
MNCLISVELSIALNLGQLQADRDKQSVSIAFIISDSGVVIVVPNVHPFMIQRRWLYAGGELSEN